MRRLLWIRLLFLNAFRNLWRAPRRTLFSLLAIGGAAASLLLFRSFVNGVKVTFRHNLITSCFGHYQIYEKGYRKNKGDNPFGYLISNADIANLRNDIEHKVGKLVFFSRQQEFYGLLNHGDRSLSARGVGTDAKEDQKFLTLNKVVSGKHLALGGPDSIFLGSGLATQLNAKVGDMVTVLATTAQGSINGLDLEVVGTFQTGVSELDNSTFYIDQETAQRLLRISGASQIVIGFSSDDELRYSPSLLSLLSSRYPTLRAYDWHELAGEMYDNSIAWLEKIFSVFNAIVLIIAGLSVLNVFSMSLLERAGEFGTLRALGTFRKEIVSLIFTESILQSLLGALLGVSLGALVILVFLEKGISMPPPMSMHVPFHVGFQIPWQSLTGIVSLCVIVAGGAGVFPAIKMARSNIVEALGRNV